LRVASLKICYNIYIMKNTNILNILIVVVVVVGAVWYTTSHKPVAPTPQNTEVDGSASAPIGKIKADVFSGTLEEVNVGCFADAECYITVDGKHVTAIMGWSQEIVGSVIGVDGFGDLTNYLGQEVEVYAQVKEDGTYTLYGSEGFYIRLK
jgi:hypothetical protein